MGLNTSASFFNNGMIYLFTSSKNSCSKINDFIVDSKTHS
jgi:hypothetical protein